MKKILLLASMLFPVAVSAQKPVATAKSVSYTVGREKAYLYRNAADTARKSGFYLEPGAEARVVGEFSPRWVVVNREGFLYFTAAQNLLHYGPDALDKRYRELLAQSNKEAATQATPQTEAAAISTFKIEETEPAKDFYSDSKPTPIYRSASDTASKATIYLKPIDNVSVVGEYSPGWAVIKREGILYIAPARQLIGYQSYRRMRSIMSSTGTGSSTDYSPSTGSYHSIQTGPRGGHYYINSHGNKTYVKRK